MRWLLLALLLWPGLALGAELRVDASGSGTHTDLSDALADAQDGDVIRIAPGTWTGDLVFDDGRDLTIEGDDAATTILQGTGSGPVVTIGPGGGGVVLRGVTVTGGVNTGNGGCVAISGSSPEVSDLILEGCQAANGGGLGLFQSNAQVTNVVLRDNQAVNPATEWWEGGQGGGLFSEESSPLLMGLRVHGNRADSYGGGIAFFDGGFPELRESWVHDNLADLGAIVANAEVELTLRRVSVTDNVFCWGGGGLLALQGPEVTVVESVFARNGIDDASDPACATDDGGPSTGVDGAGISVNEAELTLRASLVLGNEAGGGQGGGISLKNDPAHLQVERSILRGNEAGVGAGIAAHQDADSVLLDRCLVEDNVAVSDAGGAWLEAPDGVVRGVLFDNNDSANNGGNLVVEATAADPGIAIQNSILNGGTSTQGGALVVRGVQVRVESVTVHDTRTNANGSGAVHLAEVAGLGVNGVFNNNVVADSDAAWDLFSEPIGGGLGFPVTFSVLEGGTDGAVGGPLASEVAASTSVDTVTFASTNRAAGWQSYLRLASGTGVDDGDPALGDDPDDSPPDRGAFGGEGAEVWTQGDVDGDGYTVWENDCNDDDAAVHPDADETCNCRDDDCDGFVDPGCSPDGFCWDPSELSGDDDDSAGPDVFEPAAGCLLSCDATGPSSDPWAGALALLLLSAWSRGRRGRGRTGT